jgi:polysaccharide pyruvyl transferase WcaK-like protein
MREASVVLATRYHTLIMALLAGTPTVSIGYGEKHRAMLRELGLPETHVDIEAFDPAQVADQLTELADRQPELTARIDSAVAAAKVRLDRQWHDVASALAVRKDRR